jgi:hypothetical protein
VQCDKAETHTYCTLCHHYFNDNPQFVPDGDDKLIAFTTGKRPWDNQLMYSMIEITSFHILHLSRREEARRGESTINLCRG